MANHLDSLCLSFSTVKWEKRQYLPHRLVLGPLWDNSRRVLHAASIGRVSSCCCKGDCLDDSLRYFHLTILSPPTTIFQDGNKCSPVSLLKEKSGPKERSCQILKRGFCYPNCLALPPFTPGSIPFVSLFTASHSDQSIFALLIL